MLGFTSKRRPSARKSACKRGARLSLEPLEDRLVQAAHSFVLDPLLFQAEQVRTSPVTDQLDGAALIEPGTQMDDVALAPGTPHFYRVELSEPGNLFARVNAGDGAVSLTLYDSMGIPVVQSSGQSQIDPAPTIRQGLSGTTYYLRVASRDNQASVYRLEVEFTPSVSHLQTVPLTAGAIVFVQADFNGDGILDLATGNLQSLDLSAARSVSIYLGNGDGTFQHLRDEPVASSPIGLVAGDFNGDQIVDLATLSSQSVRVLYGSGGGHFQPVQIVSAIGGDALATGHFNDDQRLDLVVVGDVSRLFLQSANGTLVEQPTFVGPEHPCALAVGDFTGDSRQDLAITDLVANTVTLFTNLGAGAFQATSSISVGEHPAALVAGDFNGDRALDLAVANLRSGEVSILLGDGDGSWIPTHTYDVGNQPSSLVIGDFDGDGQTDLAVSNSFSDTVSILLGRGDGSFRAGGEPGVGHTPFALTSGDFNGDGDLDLVSLDYNSRTMTVLLGHGTGAFTEPPPSNLAGQQPETLVKGDFNGDGRLDLAVANRYSNDVSVLLGQGDGTFDHVGSYMAGTAPADLVTGDFNGDGRLDLAVASIGNYYGYHPGPSRIAILLGHGDGSFSQPVYDAVDGRAQSLVAGDFDEDGTLDLAVALRYGPGVGALAANVLQTFRGQGDGSFTAGATLTVGTEPIELVAGDFNGDFHLDLAAASAESGDVTVLLGHGNGSFTSTFSAPIGNGITALVAGDFNGDSFVDLAVAHTFYDDSSETYKTEIIVLISRGDGALEDHSRTLLPKYVNALIAGDFDGDGRLDLAAAKPYAYLEPDNVTILLGNGAGGFSLERSFPVGTQPHDLIVGDFNGDGRLDLVTANYHSADVTPLLGNGAGGFFAPILAPSSLESTPLLAHFSGAQAADSIVLNQRGQILFRKGLTGQPGAFGPPVVLNPGAANAARDVVLGRTASGEWFLVALDGSPSADSAQAGFTFYRYANGVFTASRGPLLPVGFLPAHLAAADLDGDGASDLVITAAGSEHVFVSRQTAPGVFETPRVYFVGINPSSIAFLQRGTLTDIAVTDRYSGQVSVLKNAGDGAFAEEERYRAGLGLYALDDFGVRAAVHSLEGTAGLVAGEFDGETGMDLVVLNSGSRSFTLLSGDGTGGLFNPRAASTTVTEDVPSALAASSFIVGDDRTHVAVLSTESARVSVYRNLGGGAFERITSYDAGNQPTGISIGDVSRPGGGGPDGIDDLLIGNRFGDLLILAGNGDGTFSPYRRVDQRVHLAVARGAQANTFYFSNEGSDRLASQSAARGAPAVAARSAYQDRDDGIEAPGPMEVVHVGASSYLVVANSGANTVLVYNLLADGSPDSSSKQTYFVGTDPSSLAVGDLNGDGVPDLVVANQGSNDLSIFLGRSDGNSWTLDYRPRQSSDGLGPAFIEIADVTGRDGTGAADGLPEIIVSNADSGSASILPNRGDGYFINQAPLAFTTGLAPSVLFVGNFDGDGAADLVTINTGSNSVTLIANFMVAPVITTFFTQGHLVTSALSVNFNNDGIGDILLANAGDGSLEILLGRFGGGFEFGGVLSQTMLPNLSDLALVAAGSQFHVYGSQAGSEIAVLLATFGPAPAEASFDFLPPSPGFPVGLFLFSEDAVNFVRAFFSSRFVASTASPLVSDGLFFTTTQSLFGGDWSNVDLRDSEEAPAPVLPGEILLLNLEEPDPVPPPTPALPEMVTKAAVMAAWQKGADYVLAPVESAEVVPSVDLGEPVLSAPILDGPTTPPSLTAAVWLLGMLVLPCSEIMDRWRILERRRKRNRGTALRLD